MFSYFDLNFIEKFRKESVFFSFFCFKFWSHDYLRETKIRFLATILKQNIFWMFFLLIVVFRYIQIWFRFRTEISTGIIRHKAYFARANRSDE